MSAGEPTGDRAEDDQSDGGSGLDEGRSRSSRLLWGLDHIAPAIGWTPAGVTAAA